MILTVTPTRQPLTSTPSPIATDRPAPTLTSTETPFNLGESTLTPADEWANAVLERLFGILAVENRVPPDGLAWWHSSDARGALSYAGGELFLGERKLNMIDPISFVVSTPDPLHPEILERLGTVTIQQTVLTLTFLGDTPVEDANWVISNAHPLVALKALALQATDRDRTLIAAYSPLSENTLHLVLLDAVPPQIPEPTPTPLPPGFPTPTSTRTATPTNSPTPTREPEEYMGRLVAEKIDPFIDTSNQILPEGALEVTKRHPWAGLLIWTEYGAQIAARPVAVGEAEELSFYTLNTGDADGNTTLLFEVFYVDNTTRFPDDQVYFQGQRMQEILFWMVRRAAERGGQLLVTYDDFGAHQSMIIIDFRRFITPTTSSTPTP